MVVHSDVQKRVQEEIDRVVGNDRLPDFSDREKLPYTTAVLKEVLRWHPATPTGIPHLLREDDVYEGYHIPKGAIVMGNIWYVVPSASQYTVDQMLLCIAGVSSTTRSCIRKPRSSCQSDSSRTEPSIAARTIPAVQPLASEGGTHPLEDYFPNLT